MPAISLSPLNTQTFFKFWACRAFSKTSKVLLSPKDRVKARVAAVAFAIFTLGIGTWISRRCLYDRKILNTAHTAKLQVRHCEKIFKGSNEKKISEDAIIKKALRGTREELILLLQPWEDNFIEFKKKYKRVKESLNQEGLPNPFYGDELNGQIKYLALACDLLDAMKEEPEKRIALLSCIEKGFNPLREDFGSLLKLLSDHCEVEDIPFLLTYRFGVKYGGTAFPKIILEQLIKHLDESKWKAALPYLWQQASTLMKNETCGRAATLINMLQSLLTHEKFEYAFQSLLEFKNIVTPGLPLALIKEDLPPHFLTLSERMKVIKKLVWENCLSWIKDCNNYSLRTDICEPIVSHNPFFVQELSSLMQLIEKPKTTLFSPSFENYALPEENMKLIFKNVSNFDSLIALSLTSKGNYQRFASTIKGCVAERIFHLIELIQNKSAFEALKPVIQALVPFLKAEANPLTPRQWCQLLESFEMLIFEKAVIGANEHYWAGL